MTTALLLVGGCWLAVGFGAAWLIGNAIATADALNTPTDLMADDLTDYWVHTAQ